MKYTFIYNTFLLSIFCTCISLIFRFIKLTKKANNIFKLSHPFFHFLKSASEKLTTNSAQKKRCTKIVKQNLTTSQRQYMIKGWTSRQLLIVIMYGQFIQVKRPGHHTPLAWTVWRGTVHFVPPLVRRLVVGRVQVEPRIVRRSEYFLDCSSYEGVGFRATNYLVLGWLK